MTVYLLHLSRAYKGVRHYIGKTTLPIAERLAAHRAGRGARLLAVASARGISYRVARLWRKAPRGLERQLKDRSHAHELCPVCSGRAAYERGRA